jgi:NAD(P)-dependent dehydrogenase (short-subunit alcohol dehydrogenase family)
MQMSSSRNVTIVTGAASGIGLSTARELARRGHALGLIDRNGEALGKAEEELKQLTEVVAVVGSVTDEVAVQDVVDKTVAAFGGVTGLVTSAGIVKVTPALEETTAMFRDHLEINVLGSFLCAQAVARHMVEAKTGSIVMIGSVYGSGGAPNRTAYCASKGAVHNMIQSLAVEWGPLGIRINAIAPTGVRTPMVQELIENGQYNLKGVQAKTPLGRLAEPEEIASGVCFLLSDEARMVSGSVLPVDGGWIANSFPTFA